MNAQTSTIEELGLAGLNLAPPQVLGGIRLVPLIRENVKQDLRLTRQAYREDVAVVQLSDKTDYFSYVPHGLVVSWGDGAAAFGTQVKRPRSGKTKGGYASACVLRGMVRRQSRRQLRFLPLHLAMEGLLAYHFRGPDVAWQEYSRQVLKDGLSPRSEYLVGARQIVGLEDALRVFEIHDGQVGVLIFVADAMASAFVVPHPEDYRDLHQTLLTDFFGEPLFYYGQYAGEQDVSPIAIDASAVNNFSDLRSELARVRVDWSELHQLMSSRLFGRSVTSELVNKFGDYSLQRFRTSLEPKEENHIGELILGDDGAVQYLKSYRLSAAQCRRAYLLQQLAESQWNLQACARVLGCKKAELVLRLENAGFGYVVHQHVLDAAKAWQRRRAAL